MKFEGPQVLRHIQTFQTTEPVREKPQEPHVGVPWHSAEWSSDMRRHIKNSGIWWPSCHTNSTTILRIPTVEIFPVSHEHPLIHDRLWNKVATSVRGRVGDDITVPGWWWKCMEMSETVEICTFLFFWNKYLVQIPWKGDLKSGKSSVLQVQNCSFVRRGFRRKVPFGFKHKVGRGHSGHCLWRMCGSAREHPAA